ncbi:MAG: PEP-CTERM sorting domain-containing protein [Bacteroidales bacterium]|nr:PEP-CTERM sorting domain-containing protein [Bacteroidales bacterium]
MKNLFKTLVAGVLLLAGASASADTLYWLVENDTAFDEAWLVAEAKEGGAKHYIEGVDSEAPDHTSTALNQTDLADYESDAYLFYVEMSNYNSANDTYETVATGYKWGYGDLVSSGYIATGALDVNTVIATASAGNLADAPEPSSGLLLVIGGAMLALRRRRQK